MATRYARKPLPIDHKKSKRWALASLGSSGAGPVGVQLFDLFNHTTYRAHSIELKTAGAGISPGGISVSVGASDYVDFTTPNEVSFFDFDGLHMSVRETNIGLYSWTTVSFWGMSVKIADGGLNVPGLGVSTGVAKVLFSDGKPVGGDLQFEPPPIQPPISPGPPGPSREVAEEEYITKRIRGDILFAFDKYRLKPGRRTEDALHSVGRAMEYAQLSPPEYGFVVTGHTDSIGGDAYNMQLSKRRAETVATWLKEHNYKKQWIKTEGRGKTNPVASNATAEGRAQNRRVEVYTVVHRLWKDV